MADLAEQKRPKLVVVCGPTASGKTGLGVALAQRLGGEIISADSMQIYRGLDVGTAKVTPQETCGIPHHLIDICDPQELFSVADFVDRARGLIEEITARGRVPKVVGGTGLYISSLLAGIRFVEQPPVDGLRRRLEEQAEALGPQAMWERLNTVDPAAAAGIHPNNVKRVLRALEIFEQTGTTMTGQVAASRPAEEPYDATVIGLRFADRQKLYDRIDARVDLMVEQGILDEARRVWRGAAQYATAAQAIGYKEFFPYFENAAPLEQCVEELKRASRRYAKRQLTWFGRMPQVQWLEPDVMPDVTGAACALLKQAGYEF